MPGRDDRHGIRFPERLRTVPGIRPGEPALERGTEVILVADQHPFVRLDIRRGFCADTGH
jgi:hypothetical protein